jgi:rhamnulokinase
MQAMGLGHIHSLEQARDIVRRSFELETYEPTTNRDAWEEAYARFLRLHEGAESTI